MKRSRSGRRSHATRAAPRTRLLGRSFVATLLPLVALVLGCGAADPGPAVVDGRLDLSAWPFEERPIVGLEGDWSVCWGQLLEPSDEVCRGLGWQTELVPGLWSERTSASPIGGRGVATYRLRIVLPASADPMAIRAGAPHTASRVWIDGVPVPGSGVVGESRETTTSVPRRNRIYPLEGAGEHTLQVQVANFAFRGGGLRRPWAVGDADAIAAAAARSTLREATLLGVGVLVGLAYLAQFALRPADRARGYFGLACLVLGLRAVPASISDLAQVLMPFASFEWLIRLEYAGVALVLMAGSGYAFYKVPNVMPPRTTRAVQVFSIALIVVSLVAPIELVLETVVFYLVVPAAVLALILVEYGRAWRRGVPGVSGTLVGASLFLAAIVHDVVRTVDTELGLWIEISPYLSIVWITIEASDLMHSFGRAFARVETLSEELDEANHELRETEAAVVRFVPFDLLRLLGKRSIRDVGVGDRAWNRMNVLHARVALATNEAGTRDLEADFDAFNALVRRWEPAIQSRDGFISHSVGHAIYALFPGSAESSVEAALEILSIVDHFGHDDGASVRARPRVDVGIAITTGTILVGPVGDGEHLATGATGEAIDAAPRIAEVCRSRGLRLVIGKATRDGLRDPSAFALREIDPAAFDLAGLSGPLFVVDGAAERERSDPAS